MLCSDKKDMLLKLLHAENNSEVEKILKENEKFIQWHPVNNNYHNYSDLTGINTVPMRSLVEKITNAQDHTYILKCLELGIDPKSSVAPQSIEAACELFYGVPEGDLSKLPYKKDVRKATLKKLEIKYFNKFLKSSDSDLKKLILNSEKELFKFLNTENEFDTETDSEEDTTSSKSEKETTEVKLSVLKLLKNSRESVASHIEQLEIDLQEYSKLSNIKHDLPRISCVVTGSDDRKIAPSIMVVDMGEGQNNDNFETTFLSLKVSNKRDINFVLGDHSRGSQSVLAHCDYQLIFSKRHTSFNGNGKVGFTIVKRFDSHEGPEEQKLGHSWYGYIKIDGEIPAVSILDEDFLVLPSDKPCIPYSIPFKFGTGVKMYSYPIPEGLRTGATFAFFYNLQQNFWKLHLPLKVYEARAKHQESGSTLHKTAQGLKTLHQSISKDKLEDGFPLPFSLSLDSYGVVKGEIHLFKNKLKSGKSKKDTWGAKNRGCDYFNSDEIMVVLGGQKHGAISSSFFSRNRIGLEILKETLFIALDVSDLTTRALELLLSPDRERLKTEGEPYLFLEKELEGYLSSNRVLKDWVQIRKDSLIDKEVTNMESFAKFFNKVIANSPELSKFLNNGEAIGNGKNKGTNDKDTNKDIDTEAVIFGLEDATFLKANRDIVEVPINRTASISFKSDLKAEYLNNKIIKSGLNANVKSMDIYKGRITVRVSAPKIVQDFFKNKCMENRHV